MSLFKKAQPKRITYTLGLAFKGSAMRLGDIASYSIAQDKDGKLTGLNLIFTPENKIRDHGIVLSEVVGWVITQDK